MATGTKSINRGNNVLLFLVVPFLRTNEFVDVPKGREAKETKETKRPTEAIIRIIGNTHKFKSQTNQTKINTNIKSKQIKSINEFQS